MMCLENSSIPSQVERYGPYMMPYYCAQDYGVVRLIYDRKIAVFPSFSDRKRPVNDAVLIDLDTFRSPTFLFNRRSKVVAAFVQEK